MYSIYKHPLLSPVLKQDFNDFVKMYQESNTTRPGTNINFNKNGELLTLVKQSPELLNTVSEITGTFYKDDGTSRNLFNSIQDNIMKISGKYTVTEAIKIAFEIYQDMPNEFYGIILTLNHNGRKLKINPLHPLVLTHLLKDDELMSLKYNIIVYTSSTSLAPTTTVALRNFPNYRAYLKSLIEVSKNEESYSTKIQVDQNASNMSITLVESTATKSSWPNGELRGFIPLQLLTKGIFIPYYGIEYFKVKLNSRAEIRQVTPMCGVNTGHFTDSGSEVNFTSTICTGNLSSSSFEGLYTHNHSNLSSSHHDRLKEGWKLHLRESILLSFELLNLSVPNQLEKFKAEGKSMSDYKEYLKQKQLNRTGA